MSEAGSDSQKQEIARMGLVDFCRNGIRELMKKGHSSLILSCKPSFERDPFYSSMPLSYYHIRDGKLYVGFPIITPWPANWTRKEVDDYLEIPFESYKANKLVELATKIEEALNNPSTENVA